MAGCCRATGGNGTALQPVQSTPIYLMLVGVGVGAVPRQEHNMINLAKRFANDESGATAIEYGLIAAGISVAIITVVNSLGSQLKTTFSKVTSQLATAGR
jgi:pilus assembly protein Flp/PilA